MKTSFRRTLAALALFLGACASAPAVAQPPSEWTNVARVVAVGDLHGDYAKFQAVLTEAGLIDAAGDWSGGAAHLVQLGDVPDRGDDSRKILDHLMRLERQARSAGGAVHALIGNHEAMNVEGDLRYVSAGEYASYADEDSARRRDAYYRQVVRALRASPPEEGLPVFDAAHRAAFDAAHPLGWVEHRLAWGPKGAYGKWVAGHNAMIRIDDTLYLHAGIGPAFPPATREAINAAVQGALSGRRAEALPDVTTHEDGPLWYRGLALNAETTETAHLDALLARYGVRRVIVGHTKRAPLVLPRFGGRVIVTDISVPAGQADPRGYLVIENGETFAVHRGQKLSLADPCAYIAAAVALDPPNSPSQRLVATCGAPQGAIAQPRAE